MHEWEALIQRREMLQEKVSKINYEVEKIDKRLAFLDKVSESKDFDQFQSREPLAYEVSQIIPMLRSFWSDIKRSKASRWSRIIFCISKVVDQLGVGAR
jgi:hypothetical protein